MPVGRAGSSADTYEMAAIPMALVTPTKPRWATTAPMGRQSHENGLAWRRIRALGWTTCLGLRDYIPACQVENGHHGLLDDLINHIMS